MSIEPALITLNPNWKDYMFRHEGLPAPCKRELITLNPDWKEKHSNGPHV